MIVNVMQSSANIFVMHCSSSRHAEILLNTGLTFHSYPVSFAPAPNTQWVKLTRVVYGTTENSIKSRLAENGTVLKIRQELVHGIGISVYLVKMELRKPIPSRVTIAHYPVNVLYRGQVQQCFRCEQTGHLSREYPLKKSHGVLPSRIRGPTTVQPSDLVTRSNDGSLTACSNVVQPPAHGANYCEYIALVLRPLMIVNTLVHFVPDIYRVYFAFVILLLEEVGSPFLCAPCPFPDLPYARYELIRTLLECYRVYPDLGDAPLASAPRGHA